MDKAEELLPPSELVSLSVELTSAYVSNNSVPASELPKLLSEIHSVLRDMNRNAAPAPVEEKLSPAVPVKKSVTPDFIICLEDGRSFKSLKRHLQTKYGLTPQQYREKWNLPPDYPMVAPSYAAARSALAKASGLGQLRSVEAKANTSRAEEPTTPGTAHSKADDAAPKRRRVRQTKAARTSPVATTDVKKKPTEKAQAASPATADEAPPKRRRGRQAKAASSDPTVASEVATVPTSKASRPVSKAAAKTKPKRATRKPAVK